MGYIEIRAMATFPCKKAKENLEFSCVMKKAAERESLINLAGARRCVLEMIQKILIVKYLVCIFFKFAFL